MVNSDTGIVWHALEALERKDFVWRRNCNVFLGMDSEQRFIWWTFVQQSDLPMYQTLKLKVIELRMQQ